MKRVTKLKAQVSAPPCEARVLAGNNVKMRTTATGTKFKLKGQTS